MFVSGFLGQVISLVKEHLVLTRLGSGMWIVDLEILKDIFCELD